MLKTRCEYSKHVSNVSNALLIFQPRFKCFKRVANIRNTLQMFKTRCEYSKHVSANQCFKRVANILTTFNMFKTRCKYLKHVVNIITALYSQHVANSRKKLYLASISHRTFQPCPMPFPDTLFISRQAGYKFVSSLLYHGVVKT